MDKTKKARLTKKGWTFGSAETFLGLTPEESAYIEIKLSLARELKKARIKKGLSQTALASKLGSSQSRVAKMEAADASVSLDLLIKSLLTLGASRTEVGRVIAKAA